MRCPFCFPLTMEKHFSYKEKDYGITKYNWRHWWELAAFACHSACLPHLRYFLLKYKCHHSCHQELIHYS